MLPTNQGWPKPAGSPVSLALRNAADSAPVIMWMTNVENELSYFHAGPTVLLDAHDATGFANWLQLVDPADARRVGQLRKQAMAAREAYQIAYCLIRSDGSRRFVTESAAPRFADTRYSGYHGSIVDAPQSGYREGSSSLDEPNYQLLAEHTSDLICRCDQDGNYLYVSPSYTRVLGIEADALIGKSVYSTVHPDDFAVIQGEMGQQATSKGEPSVIEIRKRTKDGGYRWFGTKVQLLTDPATGKKTGSIGICRDITAERTARHQLRQSEERFRSLTHLSSDWYWETDELDRFTFLSEGIQAVAGCLPHQLIGLCRLNLATHPDSPGLTMYRQKLASFEAFRNIPYTARNPLTGKPVHFLISGEPVYKSGVFKGYRGIGRDVTSEKAVAQELLELAEENRALIENSLDIIALLDEDGRFLRVSEALHDILGYTPPEWLGKSYAHFLHPDDLDQVRLSDLELRSGKDTLHNFETRWIRKDGSVAYLSLAVRWAKEKRVLYATARDISESYRTREELHHANRQLHTMLESIGDAFFAMDRDWRITYANLKSAEFVGVDRDAVIGKLLLDVVPEMASSSVFPHYRHAALTGENTFFEEFYEPVGAWVETRIYPHSEGFSVFFQDVSARREADRVIRENERRLRQMIAITPAGYLALGGNGLVTEANPAFCEMLGYARDELLNHDIAGFLPPSSATGILDVKNTSGFAHAKETVLIHKSGRPVFILVNLTVERADNGKTVSLNAFITDITERKQVERQLEDIATHDTLTGLPNRVLINRRLQVMLETAGNGTSIAVMFIDLDRFKEVNDSMGHAPGDDLLRQVAKRLQDHMRPTDIVARFGGDEFVVAAHCSEGRKSAAVIAEKLLASLAAPFEIEDQEVFVSGSIGISMFSEDAGTKEALFQNADTAMYRAKAAGRNNFQFYVAEMSAGAKRRMTLELALRRALEREELEVHYQPRINLKTGAMVGMEALVRWNHPSLGTISPAEFIPIAEDKGLINSIGKWILAQACHQAQSLVEKHGRKINVSVNLSAHQLRDGGMVRTVDEILRASGLAPELLELELTETALIEDLDHSVKTLKALKDFGIRLSVDDFGTGYSGLSYLKRFPVDILKLDRSFVYQQTEGVSSLDFIRAFVDMAHALKLSVVAEGIETSEILDLLNHANCDEGQGYFFARPMTLSQLDGFIAMDSRRR